MSKAGNVLLSLIGILIVVILIWYFATPKPSLQEANYQTSAVSSEADTSSMSANASASLDEDMSEIDAQFSALDSDSSSMDQSFNDKPIDQLQ